jgi:hypothetical protein
MKIIKNKRINHYLMEPKRENINEITKEEEFLILKKKIEYLEEEIIRKEKKIEKLKEENMILFKTALKNSVNKDINENFSSNEK